MAESAVIQIVKYFPILFLHPHFKVLILNDIFQASAVKNIFVHNTYLQIHFLLFQILK